jgi:phosphoglycolate phosphatase-like HAD superfamily hydrolase
MQYLFAFDFDGTLADTFTPSPNKIGVNEAHQLAIELIFGHEGLDIYNQIGGLQNRAPSELVCDLLAVEERLFLKAEKLANQTRNDRWDDNNPKNSIAEMIVEAKLSFLLEEVSEKWPLPFDGTLETLEAISGLSIPFAVLSSGHERFIVKTFGVWGIPQPKFLVTEDDVRWRKFPADICKRVKPSVFPFSILHHRWIKEIAANGHFLSAARDSRQRVIYFGDDPLKDGGLAKNVGVPFGWFNSNSKKK